MKPVPLLHGGCFYIKQKWGTEREKNLGDELNRQNIAERAVLSVHISNSFLLYVDSVVYAEFSTGK